MAGVKLTLAERLVLSALCRAVERDGHPPSLEQLGKSTGLRSLEVVQHALDALQRKQLIRRNPGRSRVVEVDCGALAETPAHPIAAEVVGAQRVASTSRDAPAERLAEKAPPQEPAATSQSTEADGPLNDAHVALDSVDVAAATHDEGDMRGVPNGMIFGRGDSGRGADPTLVTVPLLGRVAAGYPVDPDPGDFQATYQLPRALVGPRGPLFMLRVHGASMVNSGVCDQDLVVVRRQADAESGQLVVVLDEHGDAAVKRLWRSADGQREELRSDNPAYRSLELAQAEVLGTVVTVIRTLWRSV